MKRSISLLGPILLCFGLTSAQPSATSCKLPTGANMFVERYLNTSTSGEQLCDGPGPAFRCSLSGWLYVPRGSGPFVGVVLNHSSKNIQESDYCAVTEYFVRKGYVVFIPLRRGYQINSPFGPNSGELASTTLDLLSAGKPSKWPGAGRVLSSCGVEQTQTKPGFQPGQSRLSTKQIDCVRTALQKDQTLEVRIAVDWLLTLRPTNNFLVDRVALIGHGEGANIAALGSSDPLMRTAASVLLSPAEQRWNDDNRALDDAIIKAVTQRRFPVAVLQPANALSVGPTEALTEAAVLTEQSKGFMSMLLPDVDGAINDRQELFATQIASVNRWAPFAEQFICLYTAAGGKKC